jgi:hypothetical protein
VISENRKMPVTHRLFAGFLLLVVLAGCAAPRSAWRKEGVSSDATQTALSECRYQIGLSKIPADQQQSLLTQCMQGKGFRWR